MEHVLDKIPEKAFVERRVYKGGLVKRGYRVTGITCVRDTEGSVPTELAKTRDIVEYSSGCPYHRGVCFGHMCETPTGNILPPHSLSFRSGDIKTQYYNACTKAFDSDSKTYLKMLKETNYGKEGHLRSILSTPVSGSARLVCIPHDHTDPRVVFMSRSLAEGILFCAPQISESGSVSSTYIERPLREGDYVMVERAPSLSILNNQPLRLAFWDNECMGMHPKVFSYFHGDYDGDECHVYALGMPNSIREAERWRAPLDQKLARAEEYLHVNFPEDVEPRQADGELDFISYSTLSFEEIRSGDYELPMGDDVRNKRSHLEMFSAKLNDPQGTSGFLADAIKGVRDIMRQRVTQGTIGDMSRVARISAMCFTRGATGGTYVHSGTSNLLLNPHTQPSSGSPATRCTMVLCQASQQAALDSHRVGSAESKGVDLVSSMLLGRLPGGGGVPQDTLIILARTEASLLQRELQPVWQYTTGNFSLVIAKDDCLVATQGFELLGAFSPVLLAEVEPGKRRSVCKLAVSVVYNYYDLELEEDDMEDLVEALCFRVRSSTLPITTRDGMLARNLGWVETVMATDYTKLPQLTGKQCGIATATCAAFCSNFSTL